MSWNMIWPIGIVVVSNVIYNICTKSTPANADSFLSLMVTYLIAAACSFAMFFLNPSHGRIAAELKQLNWTAIVLGIVIVGLEFGYICIYRAGWQVSVGSLTANICLACVLVVVGVLFYHEALTFRRILGMILCAAGLILVSK